VVAPVLEQLKSYSSSFCLMTPRACKLIQTRRSPLDCVLGSLLYLEEINEKKRFSPGQGDKLGRSGREKRKRVD